MILIGKSRKEIAQKLNDRNVLPPSIYKVSEKVKDENFAPSKKWDVAMITRILRNESYTGILIQGVKKKVNYRTNKLVDVSRDEWIRTPNHHEPIISKEKFDEAQKILNKKIKANKNNEIDLFLGFLKCSHCGENLTVRKVKIMYIITVNHI